MTNNRPARWLFIKTGAASALVALMVALGVDLEWGAVFAVGALFGTLNWYLLGVVLIEMTNKDRTSARVALVALGAKFGLLVVGIFVVLPPVAHQTMAYLCGFSMFLVLVVLEALSQLLLQTTNRGSSSGVLPGSLGPLSMDGRTDA